MNKEDQLEQNRANAAQAIKTFTDNMVLINEASKLKAKAQRAYYLELISNGFNEDQALKLTSHLML